MKLESPEEIEQFVENQKAQLGLDDSEVEDIINAMKLALTEGYMAGEQFLLDNYAGNFQNGSVGECFSGDFKKWVELSPEYLGPRMLDIELGLSDYNDGSIVNVVNDLGKATMHDIGKVSKMMNEPGRYLEDLMVPESKIQDA